MSEIKHTPGPWTFTVENDDRYIRAGGESIMCDAPYYPYCPSGDANWHLIAAAPDLLEALKEAAEGAGFQYMTHENRRLISAAISKAEGRSS